MDTETTTQAVPETDSVLLGRYVDSGDMEAFASLVRRHTQIVYGVCVRRLWNNRDLAEDATQMVFTLLARSAQKLRGRDDVGGWLYKAAVFTATRVRDKESRHETMKSKYADVVESADTDKGSAILERARDMLDLAIAKLSERYRRVLVMHYLQGLSYEEIAAGTGNPVGTIRTHLDRAREKLRSELMRLNLALTGPVLLQLLQSESVLEAPAGLIEKCVNVAMPGGGAGNVSDHNAILKDMQSAESWSATVKTVIGVCVAIIAGAAGVLVASAPLGQSVATTMVQPESDIILEDDFRDGLAQWEIVEKTVGKDKFVPAGESAKKLVEVQKIDRNDVGSSLFSVE